MKQDMQNTYETINTSGNSTNIVGDVNVFLDFAKGVTGNGNALPYIQSQSVKDSLLLLAASDKNQSELVRQLLDQGANYKHVDDQQETALFKAVRCRASATIDVLLAEPLRATFLLNYREFSWLYTPLHHVCWLGHTEIVQQLLLYEPPLEARQLTGASALFLAAKYGKHDIVDILLRKHAEPLAINHNRDTPLIIAARYGHALVLARLLQLEAVRNSLDNANNSGDTALCLATWHGREDCARLLLNIGADIHSVNKSSSTSLLHSCVQGDLPDLLDDVLSRFSINEIEQHSTYFKASALELAIREGRQHCAAIIRSHIKCKERARA